MAKGYTKIERKIKLTDAGVIVYEQALKILHSVEDVYASVNELVQVKKGTVKLGLMPTTGVLLFPNVLAGFKREYPQIDIQMVEYNTKQLRQLHAITLFRLNNIITEQKCGNYFPFVIN